MKNIIDRIIVSLGMKTSLIPDKVYLSSMCYLIFGNRINWKKPATFSEKLQWLKVYNRKPEYTKLVDKFEVKKIVSDIIGEQYIIPNYGLWENVEDVDFDNLPNSFVIKCTHNSAVGLYICKNKENLDRVQVIKQLREGLRRNHYLKGREWPYKNVKPRIIAEKYIEPASNTNDLTDYKWYCFDGVPKYCQVIQNRTNKETIDFFDTEWKHQNFIGLNPKANHAESIPSKPDNIKTQIDIARKLSKNIPFSRIDLYEVGGHTYFGEITFYPMSGFGKFSPEQFNLILGNMLKLPRM